ncbi:MAG: SBBP repeat-containing protein [Candidatus Solibacter sp.]
MRFGVLCPILLALTTAWAADLTRPAFSYSKLIGGSGSDIGMAVATDSAGNVYVAGTTTSLDFPVTNALQPHIGGVPFRASIDGGKTWTMPGIPDPVYAVAGTAKAPATVFAGTATTMYKSADSGKTWVAIPAAGTAVVNALWVDPETPSVIHAATSRGVRKSDDAGVTWKPAPTVTGNVLAMAAHPSRPARLFATMYLGANPGRPSLYRTLDGGATWTLLPKSPFGPITLTCDAVNPDVLYAGVATAGFVSNSPTALYRSSDAGDTWTRLSQSRLTLSTFALASAPGALLAATLDGVRRSTDGGITWSATALTTQAGSVTVDPTRPQTAYASTSAGVFASSDSGLTWTSILPVRQLVETIAVVPTTPPTIFVGADPGRNVFVTKWSGDGKQMLYSTYLGGSYYDYATGIAVDKQGNAYVTGYTYSTDFPITANAIQPKNAGDFNAFLTKLGPNGNTLAYSTYLGGSQQDAAFGIALDSAANVYLTGYAGSSDFPVRIGALQTRLQQNCALPPDAVSYVAGDAFVVKFSTDGSGLRYATLLGGTCADEGIGIAVDALGSAYVVGSTTSADFPVTKGAYRQLHDVGSQTGFLAKLSPQGDSLSYATYLGGQTGAALAVAVDGKGAAHVAGTTWGFDNDAYAPLTFFASGSVPTLGYPQVGFPGPFPGAAFVAKIDPSGAGTQYVTYLGHSIAAASGIALDSAGNAWVAGRVVLPSPELFPTVHPFQAKSGDAFVTKISSDDGALLFSSFMQAAQQIALDPAGNAFVTGHGLFNGTLLVRIDGSVASPMTLEEPLRLVPAPSIDGGVAPGEIVVITGSGLGPAQEVGASLAPDGRLATTLAGTTITFDGVAAPLISVQAQKVVCIVPFGSRSSIGAQSLPSPIITFQSPTTAVQAKNGGAVSNSILLPLWNHSIEILAAVNADRSVNSQDHRAAPGSVVTFYGAGFGQTIPASEDGRINGTAASRFAWGSVAAMLADQPAQVLYAGPAPGQIAGIVQVNVRVPQIPPGSYAAAVGWAPLIKGGGDQTVTVWVGQ